MADETVTNSEREPSSKTFWPKSAVPRFTQERLMQYFELVDGETVEDAEAFSKMFTTDGVFIVDEAVCNGRQAIVENRLWYWRSFPPLTHTLKEMFVGDSQGLDVMVIGLVEATCRDGTRMQLRTAAHLNFVACESELLIQKVELFADPTKLLAIQLKTEEL